jgi:ribose/xylose/arabinose/galactoside ABC-type transport system permease subunit
MIGTKLIRSSKWSVRFHLQTAARIFFTVLAILMANNSQSRPNVQYWMSILYPIMTATSFMLTVTLLIYYIKIRPIRLTLATSFYFASETIVLALLTLTTGAHPVLSIEQYRPLVAWARFFNWMAIVWMIRDSAGMIFKDADKLDLQKKVNT